MSTAAGALASEWAVAWGTELRRREEQGPRGTNTVTLLIRAAVLVTLINPAA